MSEDEEGGVGCRPALQVLILFVGLLLIGSLAFFTADPDAIPFWRLWLFSSFAPVSGVAMSFGASGMAWSLDGGLWVLVSIWVARSENLPSRRRRLGLVILAALALGLLAASAG